MLKIKDNVDLKVLERFGFKEKNDFYEYYKGDGVCEYIIYKDDKEMSVMTYEVEKLDDVIYDLIKADMVEKVEE